MELLFWSYELGLLLGIALVIRMRSFVAERQRPLHAARRADRVRTFLEDGRGNKFETASGAWHRIKRAERAWAAQNVLAGAGLSGTEVKEVSREGREARRTMQAVQQEKSQEPEGVGTMANINEQGNGDRNNGMDHAWPGHVDYRLGFGSEQVSDVMWRCNVLRAGKLYSTSLFATKDEADEFAKRLGETEPEKMFSVEAIKAASVWN